MRLVIALYDGAIGALRQAKKCFAIGDIMGRGAAITKATNILTELTVSLDMEKGGEISVNLKKLYSYMQQRLLTAHSMRQVEPIVEVEELLMELLEAWNKVAVEGLHSEEKSGSSLMVEDYGELIIDRQPESVEMIYTGYFLESGASMLGEAYSF